MAYTQAQLVAAYTAANDGVAPDAQTTVLLGAFATQTQTGQLSDQAALTYVINSADKTTAVAVEAYQFFTGKTPTKAGLDFLVNSATNTTDLNDPYYTGFNIENRYMNFAANLGIVGEGATAFNTTYGTTAIPTYSAFVGIVYETIIGSSYAAAAGINVAAAINDVTSRQAAFTQIARDRGIINATSTQAQIDIATRAVTVGYLLVEGIKADVGIYAAGANNFSQALINGTAQYNVNLLTTYSVLGGGLGVNNGGPVSTGLTFTLTDKIDALNGGAGNDTFVGDAATVTAADTITGGAGTDTLKLFGTTTLPTLNSIEVVDFVTPGNVDINTSTVVGLNKVVVEQLNAAGGKSVTVGAGVAVQLGTVLGAAAGGLETVNFAATDTTATLALDTFQGGVGVTANDVTVTGAAVTTLNITSQTAKNATGVLTGPATATTVNITGATDLTVGQLTSVAATKVAVTGAGKVTISAADLAATVAIDASANTGGVLFTDEAAGSTLTFTGGTGADQVTFAATRFTTADKLTGGLGTDTLVINDATLTVGIYSAINAVTGFEVLGLGTTAGTVDVSSITSLNSYKVLAGNLTETFNNSASTTTYTIDNSAGNTGTVTINNKVGDTATSITLDAGAAVAVKTLANLTLSGATTVALVSTGTGVGSANTITTLNNADNSSITLTGAKDLVITNALAGTGTGTKFDASAFTGKLTLTGSGLGDIIIGGTAVDTLNGGDGKDTINGGGGNDIITVNTAAQADVLTGGAGNDSFKFAGATLAATLATSAGVTDIVRITDFVTAADKIGLVNTGAAFTSVTLATQTIATAADLTAIYAAINPVAASVSGAAASAELITVSAGAAAGTYLYVNDATAGVSNTTDMLINLTGITGTLATTDFIFA